jgi:heme/copper-type cytochrome/quinol oxidase subunit 1
VHLHFVVSIAVVFALFAGWYAFFSEITGRRYLPVFGILQFVLAFAGIGFVFAYFDSDPSGSKQCRAFVSSLPEATIG